MCGARRRLWNTSSDEGIRTSSLVGGMSNFVRVRALVESGDNVVSVSVTALSVSLCLSLSLPPPPPCVGHVRALFEPTLVSAHGLEGGGR